jgi:DNA helicase II / ATP-dependent DNA helicase PcrA
MFPVLIHAHLHEVLRRTDRRLRARVQKTLARLQDGRWGGGTRVKRLAGVRRPVFEARTDAGDRLLFTIIRSADRTLPDRSVPHLQVWDLVHHDAVTRRARRNPAPESEFLEFETVEAFEISEPPPVPAAAFDEIADDDGAGPLLHYLLPPDQVELHEDEGLHGAVRWYLLSSAMLASEDEFQRIIGGGGAELELKLTREQYGVLHTPGPVLLAGSAGSGKTTIAVHRLAAAALQPGGPRAIYLSYSSWLVDHARRLYRDLLVARGADPEKNLPDFFTFTDLYLKVIPHALHEHQARPMTIELFQSWCRRANLRLDAALVWEELRSILKGACLAPGRPMLGAEEYYDLGRKRAPLFAQERPEIFRIGQRYQEWLQTDRRTDQIDLCRAAFRELRHGRGRRYDTIVCDEVQDLTELEVAFVLSLTSSPDLSGVLLAGDVQQIVNPSGFRWAEVRQAVVKTGGRALRNAPSLMRLRRNFRSVRPLVDLANGVLALRREIFGRSDEDDLEEAVVEGPVPVEVIDDDAAVLEGIRDFGPRCAVIVLDSEEGERLKRSLETTRVFHVREAKGLEFEAVILWKPLRHEQDRLARLARSGERPERDARYRQLLQHLYVAVTRARRHLAIHEGSTPHPFWSAERWRGRLERDSAAHLPRLFRGTASPAEWASEGDFYLRRQHYRQAAECYRRAGLADRALHALALFAESVERWPEALERWHALGDLGRQAPILERLGRLSEAAEIYRRTGNHERLGLVEVQLLEEQRQWAEAARRWEALGRTAEALRCYQKAGNRGRTLSLQAAEAERMQKWARAAACHLELHAYEAAARCFRKGGDRTQAARAAARHHEQQKDWSKAATHYGRAGERTLAARCRARAQEQAGKLKLAAAAWERLGDHTRALELYRKTGDRLKIAQLEVSRLDLKASQLDRVRNWERDGKWEHAAILARLRIAHLRAGLRHSYLYAPPSSTTGPWHEIRELERVEARCRAECAERDQDWTAAATAWQQAGRRGKARSARIHAIHAMKNPAKQGEAWTRLAEWDHAIEAYTRAGDERAVAQVKAVRAESNKDWAAAAEFWAEAGFPAGRARCLAEIARAEERWADAARLHMDAGQKTLAREAEKRALRRPSYRDRLAPWQGRPPSWWADEEDPPSR